MILVDNYTQFTSVYPLKCKSDTFPTFVKLHALVKSQFQKAIKPFSATLVVNSIITNLKALLTPTIYYLASHILKRHNKLSSRVNDSSDVI